MDNVRRNSETPQTSSERPMYVQFTSCDYGDDALLMMMMNDDDDDEKF